MRLVAASGGARSAERTSATTPQTATGGATATEETATGGASPTEEAATGGAAATEEAATGGAAAATSGRSAPTAGAPTHQDHREHDDDDQDEHRAGRRRVSGRNDACHVPHATAYGPTSERAAPAPVAIRRMRNQPSPLARPLLRLASYRLAEPAVESLVR
jgi:hypothetical protein